MIHKCFHYICESTTLIQQVFQIQMSHPAQKTSLHWISLIRKKKIRGERGISLKAHSPSCCGLVLVSTCWTHCLQVLWREQGCPAPSLILTSRRWTLMAPLCPFALNTDRDQIGLDKGCQCILKINKLAIYCHFPHRADHWRWLFTFN